MGQRSEASITRQRLRGASRLVAILQDDVVRADRLRQVLERLRCRVIDVFPTVSLPEMLAIQRDVDLVTVPVSRLHPETFDRVKYLAAEADDERPPLLALARPDDVVHCLEMLRDSGIAGLLATDASLSQIEFRLNGVLDLFSERRQRERVGVLLPVDVRDGDVVSHECCISLSIAGLGIASRRPLEPNTEIALALHPGAADAPIELRGRIIHCLHDAKSVPPFRIGVYFPDPPADVLRRLETLVARAS